MCIFSLLKLDWYTYTRHISNEEWIDLPLSIFYLAVGQHLHITLCVCVSVCQWVWVCGCVDYYIK